MRNNSGVFFLIFFCVFSTTREALMRENARKWERERRLAETLLAEAAFLQQNERDADIFAR